MLLKVSNQGSASKRVFRLLFARLLRGVVCFLPPANGKKFCFLLLFQGAKKSFAFSAKQKILLFAYFLVNQNYKFQSVKRKGFTVKLSE